MTTVHQSGSLIGKTASKYLIQEIEDNTKTDLYTSKTVEISANLIVRSSSLRLQSWFERFCNALKMLLLQIKKGCLSKATFFFELFLLIL